MASNRAYLIVSKGAESGARSRVPSQAGRPERPTGRRPPTVGAATRRRTVRGPACRDDIVVLVRRHRPGRHRRGGSGFGHYRAARPAAAGLVHRRLARVPHRARHAAAPPPAASGATLTRYGTGVVVLATLMVSGWFAASGASAIAQMVRP